MFWSDDDVPFSSSGLESEFSGIVTTARKDKAVKRGRYAEKHISCAPKQAETGTAVDVIRRMGILEQTFTGGRSYMAGSTSAGCVGSSDLTKRLRLVYNGFLCKCA